VDPLVPPLRCVFQVWNPTSPTLQPMENYLVEPQYLSTIVGVSLISTVCPTDILVCAKLVCGPAFARSVAS
jgi:hypothetical protein